MPRIKDESGKVVWEVNAHKYNTNIPWSMSYEQRRGSWYVEGGTVVVKDGDGNVVEARQLKPGETVEGI